MTNCSDTLSLDMGHIKSLLQTQNDSTKLEVKGIAVKEQQVIVCDSVDNH